MLVVLVLKDTLPDCWTFYRVSRSGNFYLFICVRGYDQTAQAVQTIIPDVLLFDQPVRQALTIYDRVQDMKGLKKVPVIIMDKGCLDGEVQQEIDTRHITYAQHPYGQEELLDLIKSLCTARI